MTDKQYDPKKLALELGFTEAKADRFARQGYDADKIRRVAVAMNMPSTKPTIPAPTKPRPVAFKEPTKTEPSSKHRHSYRKDGTCACGAVRKAKRA